jgi:hypothetical protein
MRHGSTIRFWMEVPSRPFLFQGVSAYKPLIGGWEFHQYLWTYEKKKLSSAPVIELGSPVRIVGFLIEL